MTQKHTETHENRAIYTYLSSCDNSEVHFHNAFDGALLQASLWKAIYTCHLSDEIQFNLLELSYVYF